MSKVFGQPSHVDASTRMTVMSRIYLDHAATTPLAPEVLDAMLPLLKEKFGNASSAHRSGRTVRGVLEECRERIAAHLSASPAEIVFTSGGTESDNAALRGILTESSMGLITSATEHEAVLQTAVFLEKKGHEVVILKPGMCGAIAPAQVRDAIVPGIRLVSLAYVNNETGAVTDLKRVSDICREHGAYLHTDAVQAACTMDLDVDALGVDLLTLSGHKIYGPKGIGVLYVRSGIQLDPLIRGGPQERKRRAGTENVAAIAGMAAAMDLVRRDHVEACEHITLLRVRLLERLRSELHRTFVVNTPIDGRAAAHILNVAFQPVDEKPLDGAMLLLNLDLEGVQVSGGSACSSGAVQPSHVLLAMGLDSRTSGAAIRFSLGRSTTADEVDIAAASVARVVNRMKKRRTR